MANKVELTAEQLATLDLWIAKRIESPEYWITCQVIQNIHNNNGPDNLTDNSVESQQKLAKNVSLQDLLELRNNAVKGK